MLSTQSLREMLRSIPLWLSINIQPYLPYGLYLLKIQWMGTYLQEKAKVPILPNRGLCIYNFPEQVECFLCMYLQSLN
jgi:hypothetical protein